MSLDVYLYGPREKVMETCPTCGHTHEVEKREEFFWKNITHNLNEMAEAAGIYKELWRPDEIGITKAGQLTDRLKKGLANLRKDPEKYRAFNPKNGWGSYERLIGFMVCYLAACEENPEAEVKVSR